MKDICLNCGKEHNEKLWGVDCSCDNSNVVHREKCMGCDNIIGYINDDDYVGLQKIYCSDCINKIIK